MVTFRVLFLKRIRTIHHDSYFPESPQVSISFCFIISLFRLLTDSTQVLAFGGGPADGACGEAAWHGLSRARLWVRRDPCYIILSSSSSLYSTTSFGADVWRAGRDPAAAAGAGVEAVGDSQGRAAHQGQDGVVCLQGLDVEVACGRLPRVSSCVFFDVYLPEPTT